MATLLHRVAVTRRVAKVRDRDPWRRKLEGLQGQVDNDGVERVTVRAIFDILELPHRGRSKRESIKIARLMSELGWTKRQFRGFNAGGHRAPVKGYVREASI